MYQSIQFLLFRTIKAKEVKTHGLRLGKTKTMPLRLQTDSHFAFSELSFFLKQALSRKSAVPLGTRASCLEQSSALSQPLGQVHVRGPHDACAGQGVPGSPNSDGKSKPVGKSTGGWPSPAQQQVSRTSEGAARLLLPFGQSCSFCHLSQGQDICHLMWTACDW